MPASQTALAMARRIKADVLEARRRAGRQPRRVVCLLRAAGRGLVRDRGLRRPRLRGVAHPDRASTPSRTPRRRSISGFATRTRRRSRGCWRRPTSAGRASAHRRELPLYAVAAPVDGPLCALRVHRAGEYVPRHEALRDMAYHPYEAARRAQPMEAVFVRPGGAIPDVTIVDLPTASGKTAWSCAVSIMIASDVDRLQAERRPRTAARSSPAASISRSRRWLPLPCPPRRSTTLSSRCSAFSPRRRPAASACGPR